MRAGDGAAYVVQRAVSQQRVEAFLTQSEAPPDVRLVLVTPDGAVIARSGATPKSPSSVDLSVAAPVGGGFLRARIFD